MIEQCRIIGEDRRLSPPWRWLAPSQPRCSAPLQVPTPQQLPSRQAGQVRTDHWQQALNSRPVPVKSIVYRIPWLPDAIRSAGQAVSDLIFTLSNPVGTLGTTSATGQQGNISASNVVTYVAGSPGRFIGVGGGTFSATGSTITLEAIGGGQPSEMIAPFVANGGTFSNLNAGFDNFIPYTIGPATFTLALSGITARHDSNICELLVWH